MQFQSVNKANIPKVSDGLDTTTLDHEKLLKAVSTIFGHVLHIM